MNERQAYNTGFNAKKYDDLSYYQCKALEKKTGHKTAFWNGWNDAFDEKENKAADLLWDRSVLKNSLNYYCRKALSCVTRDSSVVAGQSWVKPTSELMEEALFGIFPFFPYGS